MSSFGYQPHPNAPKDIREYRQHRQQVLGAVRDYSFKGVRAHRVLGHKKTKKEKKKKKTTFIPPQPPVRIGQQQFLGIHNTALSNRARDLKVVENIDKRLKEDKTMTDQQEEVLKDLRAGLIL
mgnify:CR=1 FL=1|jgi:hypothetical protein|tara:strand:- start:117 stop:485 length:369 start_codon:yes stop_codon:yes gene_type:complete